MNYKLLKIGCLLLVLVVLSACGDKTIPDKLNWEVQDFEAADTKGETVSRTSLDGKVWLANFAFTSCTTVCPPMTANLVKLQGKLSEADVPVQLVTFTVDPEHDTPEVREEFIKERGGELSNWSFLGGYEFSFVKNLSVNSFKSDVRQPPEGTDQFTHGTSLFLVNQEGSIVKKYNGYQDVPFDKIVEHAKILTSKEK